MPKRLYSRRTFLKQLLQAGAVSLCFPSFARAREFDEFWHERMRPLMGTFVSVGLIHPQREEALAAIGKAFKFIEERSAELSTWQSTSEICRLERGEIPAAGPVLAQFFRQSDLLKRQTDGLVNLHVGALTGLWRAAKAANAVPSAPEVSAACAQVQTGTSRADVGGFGKGFIADLCAEFLATQGFKTGRIACSGDLRFFGKSDWVVELEDPRRDGIRERISVHGDVGVSTSGDYNNCWFVGGERYHHLIDLKSGYPARYNQAASVIAPSAAVSDALSSALFLAPPNRAATLLARFEGSHGLSIDKRGMDIRY